MGDTDLDDLVEVLAAMRDQAGRWERLPLPRLAARVRAWADRVEAAVGLAPAAEVPNG